MSTDIDSQDLKVIAVHVISERQKCVLLRKYHTEGSKKSFDISNSFQNFEWLTKVQNICSEHGKIILYSENEPLNGILGFVNSLKYELGPSNIQSVFIFDGAPKYDPKHSFYATQLNKGLSVNIWKDQTWGTYRHLLINEHLKVERIHRYISFTKPGDLTSAKWLEGPFSVKQQKELLVNVIYSANRKIQNINKMFSGVLFVNKFERC